MIRFDGVGVRYDGAEAVLTGVDLEVPEGELVLVAGPTGSGKSTLLGLINGLVPHFTGGTVTGEVTVAGRRISRTRPRDLAGTVGRVGQDPSAEFVTDTVEAELAYGMEQQGIAPAAMRKRVEETLDLLGIADLRRRALRQLSGGQQQRVAIAAVLAAGPRILVLDEPTSSLDPTSADEVLGAVLRLVHDLGVTAVVAEHRMERVLQYADRVLLLDGRGTVRAGRPAIIAGTAMAPPVVELSDLVGWSPPALSVRDARRRAVPLRDRLGELPEPARDATPDGLTGKGLTVRYGTRTAVAAVDVTVGQGEVVALMGRNGAGKSSLLWALTEHGRRVGGTVRLHGATAPPGAVALVPQTAADLLYLDTVAAECRAADQAHAAPDGSCAALLETILPGVDPAVHPRDLSEGQRLGLVLAIQLVGTRDARSTSAVLLDEPTRGLDYLAKRTLAAVLSDLAAQGCCILVATHDVEFAAIVAHRVVVMAEGEVVSDGSALDVLTDNPAFAPQVAKVLYPARWLTVDQVRHALAVAG